MSFEFIPQFPHAPVENTRYIAGHTDALPLELSASFDLDTRARENSYREAIDERRVTAKQIAQGEESLSFAGMEASDWPELSAMSVDWLKEHLRHMRVLDSQAGRDKSTSVIGREGVVTIAAFLEVIPQVIVASGIAYDDMEAANENLYRRARLSQGFITTWARLGVDIDKNLAQALATYSRESHRSRDVFTDLHFDARHFTVESNGERVGIDPSATLRNWSGSLLSEKTLRPAEKLFGCPALFMIPRLYEEMALLAHENRMFGIGYLAAFESSTARAETV